MSTATRIEPLKWSTPARRACARGFGALRLSLGALGLSALSLGACHRDAAQSESAPAVAKGIYRAVLTLPGGDLPFGLELAPAAGKGTVGFLVNGTERVKLDEVTIAGAHLEIRMPGYENRLIADAKGDELEGEVVLVKLGGKQQHIPLHAQRGRQSRPARHSTLPRRASFQHGAVR